MQQDSYTYIKIRICIHQHSYIYNKICIYTLRFVQFRHKGKTEGMTEDITPASNIEEELSRVFPPRVGAQQPPRLCNPRVNYGSNGSSGKKGRLRSSSWKVKSAKESPHSISCKELGAILEHPATITCH